MKTHCIKGHLISDVGRDAQGACKACRLERSRLRRQTLKERLNAQQRALYAAKPGVGTAATARWAAAHPDKVRAVRHSRRAKLKGAFVEEVRPLVVFKRDRWICQICHHRVDRTLDGRTDPMGPTLDHIIPLAKGGLHSYANCQLAHRRCNSLKGIQSRNLD